MAMNLLFDSFQEIKSFPKPYGMTADPKAFRKHPAVLYGDRASKCYVDRVRFLSSGLFAS